MAGEPTFAPPVAPGFPLRDSREPKVRKVTYGDGYLGRVPDGMNNDREMNTWVWENLTYAEYSYIWTFFKNLGGVGAFLYAVPWGGALETKKWIAPKYDRERVSAAAYNISVSVEQVFEF